MAISQCENLSEHFLLAMPGLQDSIFTSSLTYLFEHSAEGAAGLVINKPTAMNVGEIFEQLKLPESSDRARDSVLVGGPVSPEQGFVVHREGDWSDTVRRTGLCISTSLDILRSMATGNGPDEALVILGYAGWAPGQLETELANNAWLTLPADPDIIFDTPISERAGLAAKKLGFDLSKLGSDVGHA